MQAIAPNVEFVRQLEVLLMERRIVEPLWTPSDVATYLGVPVQTLYQWRHKGVGPPGVRIGRHLRYDPSSVRAWLSRQTDAAT